MKTPETNNFTPLRLALALLVVLGHFVTLPGLHEASGIFGYATFAVDMFFVVSGYLIFASFDNRPLLGGFYIRRVFRIYPLYLAIVIVQGLIMAALLGGVAEHAGGLLRYLGANIIMANFMAYDIGGLLSGLHNPGINPSLWTLKIELAFYFLLPLLWYATRRYSWFLAALYAASTIYAMTMQHYGMDALARQLPGQLRFFAIGMALYHYRDRLTFPTWLGVIAAVALFLFCHAYFDAPLAMPVVPLCVGLIMYICAFRLPVIPLRHDISYGVYLLHGPLIQFSLLLGIFQDTTAFLALLIAAVILLALAAERIIEQPGIECGKWLARIWSTRFGNEKAQPI